MCLLAESILLIPIKRTTACKIIKPLKKKYSSFTFIKLLILWNYRKLYSYL